MVVYRRRRRGPIYDYIDDDDVRLVVVSYLLPELMLAVGCHDLGERKL